MPNKNSREKKAVSADWLVQGTLTKIGDMFDRLTGRGWKPSSSLATSELAERLKLLLDSEATDTDSGKFVPHLITLRMQWDKFSADSEMSIKKLENELLTAAVDHINDRRYYTYGPLSVEVRSDYFTEGVTVQTAFGTADGAAAGELQVTVPDEKISDQMADVDVPPLEVTTTAAFNLEGGSPKVVSLHFMADKQLSVGRTKENHLMIDDISVSKYHASLLMNAEGKYFVADTGSTNGTFVNGTRISYGKAIRIRRNDAIRFGAVEVNIDLSGKPPEKPSEVLIDTQPETSGDNTVTIGDLEFTSHSEEPQPAAEGRDGDKY